MTKSLHVIVLIFFGFSVVAQNISKSDLRSDRYVYYNVGALLNIPSGLQFGIEQRLHNNWFWDLEGGVLLFKEVPTLMDFNAKNRSGMRFQTGAKVFLTDYFFIGPQFLFKRVKMEEQEWLWRFDNTYRQRFNTERTRRTYAVAAEFGWHFVTEASPFSVEISYAFGLQNFNIRYDNSLPPDVSFDDLSGLGSRPGTYIYPFFNYRIKMKYALNWVDTNVERVEQKSKESKRRKKNKRSRRNEPRA